MKAKAARNPGPRKPTMNDVARLAGVGTMTVSRVLSGTAHVSEDTAQKVRIAVEQLQYHRNELARVFRGQQSRTIGLIVPYLYDSFFANCAHAIAEVVKERGYSMILTTSDEDPEIEYAAAEKMIERHVEGVVMIPARNGEANAEMTQGLFKRTPVVAFDRPAADTAVDVVLVQNSAGARRMVEHLIQHGHKRICFAGLNRSLYTINARFTGYRQAMREAGLDEDVLWECTSQERTLSGIEEKLKSAHPPTAIFSSNNLATRFVLSSLITAGIKIPGDMALGGFDDFDLAEMTSPPLSVIRQPAHEMGKAAINLLFDRIEKNEISHEGNRIVLPVEMVLRRSCGCKHRIPQVIR
jgi:LacI family transcriptional regulator